MTMNRERRPRERISIRDHSVNRESYEVRNRVSTKRHTLRDKLEHFILDLFPSLTARIDYIVVPRARNLEQVHIFLLLVSAFLFDRDIVAAETRENHVICGSVNQPLPSARDRKLGGIGFVVVVGNLAGVPRRNSTTASLLRWSW